MWEMDTGSLESAVSEEVVQSYKDFEEIGKE